jgi:hypothetical protein
MNTNVQIGLRGFDEYWIGPSKTTELGGCDLFIVPFSDNSTELLYRKTVIRLLDRCFTTYKEDNSTRWFSI